MLPPSVDWNPCPPEPMAWIRLREPILQLITTPALLVPLLAGLALLFSAAVGLGWAWRALLSGLAVALISLIYSPLSTAGLSAWLTSQLPDPPPPHTGAALAVLVGRGPGTAVASTTLAARMVRDGRVERIYVSGDSPSTVQLLLFYGVSPARIAGDNCARTTWENAIITNAWIRDHTPPDDPAPRVLLITDPWQLPRASRAFLRQKLLVTPVAVDPRLPPRQQNRLALRETAATFLYALQGRM